MPERKIRIMSPITNNISKPDAPSIYETFPSIANHQSRLMSQAMEEKNAIDKGPKRAGRLFGACSATLSSLVAVNVFLENVSPEQKPIYDLAAIAVALSGIVAMSITNHMRKNWEKTHTRTVNELNALNTDIEKFNLNPNKEEAKIALFNSMFDRF